MDIRVVANDAVIDSIEQALSANGVAASRSRIVDPSYLGLDLSTVADLATIVGVAAIADPLLPTLWQWLRPGGKPTRIVVETPLGRAVFDTREELTEAEVREKLDELVGLLG